MVEPEDARIQTTIDLSKDCFNKAVSNFPYKVESIEIPYEGTTLPGYFYHAIKENNNKQSDNNSSNNNRANIEKNRGDNETTTYPTLLVHGGFDSTLEELYSSAAASRIRKRI